LLFDERPKTNRNELFNRDKELRLLHSNVNRPLILITGIRRIGKTSLLNAFMSEINLPHFIIDARSLKSNYGVSDLYRLMAKALSSSLGNLTDILSRIRRIKILGNEVELAWRGEDYLSISELFDELNRKRMIIAIDEAQLLRGPNSLELKNAIAHSYDYNRNLTFILTGSEVGLLYDFIGTEDSNSPLYGRNYYEVQLERFDKKTSTLFLEKGFEEAELSVSKAIIEEAVSEFDGIVGWLAYFGNQWVTGNRDIKQLKEKALKIAKREMLNLSLGRSRRFLTALKCIAEGKASWVELKRCVENMEGKTISTSVLYNVLTTLEDLNLVKNYDFVDPVYKQAAKIL
jgi:AAA+ ATPase superfamily predicted ATPase